MSVHPGEVLGVAALEGQGQEELFDCIAGVRRFDDGAILAQGKALKLRHPADAISAGLVLVPANRLQALLQQRSIRENVALPMFRRLSRLGTGRDEGGARAGGIGGSAACRSTRARNPNCAASAAAISRRSSSRAGSPAASRRCSVSTRPAASTSAPSSRSMRWFANWRRRAPPFCCSPPNWRKFRSPAIAPSSCSAAASSAKCRPARPTRRRCCARRMGSSQERRRAA